MATYTLDLQLPLNLDNIEEIIEALRGIGAVDSIQFTIEAPNRRQALHDTLEVLDEIKTTHLGSYLPLDEDDREAIDESLKRGKPRDALRI